MSTRKFTSGPPSRRGFALVLCVVLLSLLVLVLVMVASLTRVETSIAGNTRKFSQARQNALFGFERALAKIQAAAGPDQRVTATGDFLGAHPDKRFWSGVLDTTGSPTQSPVWLVSGLAPNPSNGVPAPTGDESLDWVELVGVNTANNAERVSAEKEAIVGDAPDGTANVTLGRFAYWAGDEGVKARVNLHDPFVQESAGAWTADNLPSRIDRHQAPQSSGVQNLSGFGGINLNDPIGRVEKVRFARQLRYVEGGPDIPSIKDNFHVISPHSSGVIADTLNGGLKVDLTPYFINGDAVKPGLSGAEAVAGSGVTFGELRAWWKDGFGRSGFTDPVFSAVDPRLPPDDPAGGAALLPILVRFSVFVGTTEDRSGAGDPALRLHLVPVLALWNPYTIGLSPATYRFELDWDTSFTFTVNGTDYLQPYVLPRPLEFIVPDLSFRAGECRILSVSPLELGGGWTPYDPAGANLLAPAWFEGNAFYFDATTPVTFPDAGAGANEVVIHERASASFGEVRLFLGANTPEPYQIISNGGAWGYVPQANRPDPAVYAPPYILDSTTDRPIPVVYRGMVEHGAKLFPANWWYWQGIDHETADLEDELGGSFITPPDPYDPPLQEVQIQFGVDGADPSYHFAYTGLNWKKPVAGGNPVAGQRFNGLFEVPREDTQVLSVGRLQHVLRTREPWETSARPALLVRRLFDEVPGLEAALWDRYFFSSVPDQRIPAGGEPNVPSSARPPLTAAEIGNPEFRLPNSRLRFYKPGGDIPAEGDLRFTGSNDPMVTSAGHLLIHGAFNINSVSEAAWRVVLNSFLGVEVDTAYAGQDGGGGSVFSRFSHPLWTVFETPGSVPGPIFDFDSGVGHPPFANRADVWGGGRRLTTGETAALAAGIVAGIRNHGIFFSLQDFVASNIVGAAIEGAGLNANIRPTPPPGADPSEEVVIPGMLTQRDVLQALGSILTPRSDTFLVRAYGETVNPVTDRVEGRAWCEAVVQRVPDYIEPTQTPSWQVPAGGSNNFRFGRRFVVVSFRWLTPADL